MWFKNKENRHVLINQLHGNFRSKILYCRKIRCVFRDVKRCFNASWGLKGLTYGQCRRRWHNINPLTPKLFNLNFHPQVSENCSDLRKWRSTLFKSCTLMSHFIFNPCAAELFQIIFHSFKAGIANAISSFKWRKIWLFMKNKHLPKWNIWLAEHLPLHILSISVAFIWVETGSSRTRVNMYKKVVLNVVINNENPNIWGTGG